MSLAARRPIVSLALLALALLAATGPARGAAPEEVESARRLGREGAELYRAGDYAEALRRFEEANRLVPHPNLEVNIGRCYEQLGQLDRALLHCKVALAAPGVPEPTRRAARECVDRVNARLARPVLRVTSHPPGATVRIDGRPVGVTPWEGEVSPGRRQIDLELADHAPASRTVDAVRGERHAVEVVLVPARVGGLLTVTSTPPGATVSLDDEPVGRTPLRSYQLDARNHLLEVALDGHAPQVSTISITDGSHLERHVTLVPIGGGPGESGDRALWPGWALVGAGVAAAGVAGWYGYQALDARDRADALARTSGAPEDRPRYDRLVDEMEGHRTASDLLWIGSGALVTGGLTWLLWPDD